MRGSHQGNINWVGKTSIRCLLGGGLKREHGQGADITGEKDQQQRGSPGCWVGSCNSRRAVGHSKALEQCSVQGKSSIRRSTLPAAMTGNRTMAKRESHPFVFCQCLPRILPAVLCRYPHTCQMS
jgi:hypothetical protein